MTTDRKLPFLPTSKKELRLLKWDYVDVILFSGDAYIDHPSFGAAVIGRVLEREGYRVAIVPQPNWRDDLRDFKKLGQPRLFFGISGGCMDSMVNHYTANKRLRSNDAYSPDGKAGFRPDYAVSVYGNILKKLYPDTPVVIGGIEASLRRFTHYDYWQDKLLPSILVDSKADILTYGMGEKASVELAARLQAGECIDTIRDIPQTAYLCDSQDIGKLSNTDEMLKLYSYEECLNSKKKFAENFKLIEEESNKTQAATIVEPIGKQAVVVNPTYPTMTEAEVDASFELPYTRLPHPRYKNKRIPAYEMIRHSITLHRGCFGGCGFCTISAHQGKFVSSRSESSILRELESVINMSDYKGYVSDIGGPSANMYGLKGKNDKQCAICKRPSCLHPKVCKNLNIDLTRLTELYSKISNHPKIKKAFVGSGVRYDIFLDENGFINKSGVAYFKQLMRYHVSGRLKVAPEHTADRVLLSIRKPSFRQFEVLKKEFDTINRKENLKLQLIPYFISSLPYCTNNDMQVLATITERLNFRLEQVQDFTPTPMTLATAIYYSGIDPYTGERCYIARQKEEKQKQLSYFFRYKNRG
ncbi:MAG: YgiQ family radical SAM protein [Prevotellaceae bacterium]|jgi:uncharacterized radical SAM protein YgiQ|nr:YgiQ family radical SAM protein [Prevotellaceae bacterium]